MRRCLLNTLVQVTLIENVSRSTVAVKSIITLGYSFTAWTSMLKKAHFKEVNEAEEVIETSSAYEAENENNTGERMSFTPRSQLSIKSSSHWYQLHNSTVS